MVSSLVIHLRYHNQRLGFTWPSCIPSSPTSGLKAAYPSREFLIKWPDVPGCHQKSLIIRLTLQRVIFRELWLSRLRGNQVSKKLLQSTIIAQFFWSFYGGFSFCFHLSLYPYGFIAQIYFCVMAPSAPL